MKKRSNTLNRGDRLTIHIDRLSVGGRGVGRAHEVVVFVSDVCPDEDVDVEITFVKKNFAEARLISVQRASTSRVTPPCPVAGVCGGCNWQHVEYGEQLRQKRGLVRDSLKKFSGFDVANENSVRSVIPSPRIFRYRNRVQFHHDGGELGYYQRGSHRLVAIDDCPIAEESIAGLIPQLKSDLKKAPAGRIEVFIATDGTVQTRVDSDENADHTDEPGGLSFAFSQVNTAQNGALISSVIDAFSKRLPASAGTPIFDLYAGSGNFTFPLASAFPKSKLTAVEWNRESVERAQITKQQNFSQHDMQWIQSDVAAFLAHFPIPGGSAVLMDPPRSGCAPDVVDRLAHSPLSFLVYVSCHPVTMARDLRVFHEAGFVLEMVQPFDMFPQTDHVESLVVLTRSTSV